MNWLDTLAADAIENPALVTFNRGIEREALRVTDKGLLSSRLHPDKFGSKLTHPKITTDFSESQLELITPVQQSVVASLAELDRILRYVNNHLGDELLWSASMPCTLGGDAEVPLADFGTSNIGKLKKTYRSGLGYRYGRGMQTICAIHYNFSFPEIFWDWLQQAEGSQEDRQTFVTRRYFDLMRNFRRYSWLLTYLFGASPAVCESFIKGKTHSLESLDSSTAYLPYATSLRSGNLGYQSDIQANEMKVCYNSLDDYVATLATAITTPHTQYQAIGTHVDGEYRQINANMLQSEAEFYSSIRAKRIPAPGENFLAALKNDGVQYIEVRLLDINPYLPLGIDAASIQFIDTFLLYCLLTDSPQHDDALCDAVATNTTRTVMQGRDPEVMLLDNGKERRLTEWGNEILTRAAPIADLFDALGSGNSHRSSLELQHKKLAEPAQTPSGSMLQDMQQQRLTFVQFALDQAAKHRSDFEQRPLSPAEVEAFDQMTVTSVDAQAAIETASTGSFDDYLAQVAADYQPLRGDAS